MPRATRDVEEREKDHGAGTGSRSHTSPPRGFPLTDFAYALGGRRTFTSPTSTLPRVCLFGKVVVSRRKTVSFICVRISEACEPRVIAEINR
jgi:hypothetical protein